ncbi:MAG: nucleotide exchange factor GrpE [Acidobacteria bacterium]|nr:nucleotide exchange factor GrpE [Acidobacteriota bacterium]
MENEKEIAITEKGKDEEKDLAAAQREQKPLTDRRKEASDLTAVGGEEKEAGPQEDFFADALAALQKERDSYYDQLLRKQAEFENYRKRVEREKADARFAAKQEILRELLNVLDACERGLRSMELHEQNLGSYREGYELLHRQMKTLLAKFGVEEIEAVGQLFDPNLHEAVLYEPSDAHREGEVIEEIKKGYRLQDRLLRPAQVKVAWTETAD